MYLIIYARTKTKLGLSKWFAGLSGLFLLLLLRAVGAAVTPPNNWNIMIRWCCNYRVMKNCTLRHQPTVLGLPPKWSVRHLEQFSVCNISVSVCAENERLGVMKGFLLLKGCVVFGPPMAFLPLGSISAACVVLASYPTASVSLQHHSKL